MSRRGNLARQLAAGASKGLNENTQSHLFTPYSEMGNFDTPEAQDTDDVSALDMAEAAFAALKQGDGNSARSALEAAISALDEMKKPMKMKMKMSADDEDEEEDEDEDEDEDEGLCMACAKKMKGKKMKAQKSKKMKGKYADMDDEDDSDMEDESEYMRAKKLRMKSKKMRAKRS